MGRTVRGRGHTPYVRPVQKVELSEKHVKQRFFAVMILLIIGSCAFVYALNGLMGSESGWTEIKVSSSADINCGEDFIFRYNIGNAGVSASAESKALTLLYTEASQKAYKMFNNDASYEGITSVYDINQKPNQELVVDEALYHAFELMQRSGRRELYLAPVYAEYDNLFFCSDDSETVNYDAYRNEDVKDYFSEVIQYAGSPEMINLELLGDNKVILHVSEEYLAYAKQNYISDFIDFYWMKNAFITDYLADVMVQNGYTFGSVSSYDGFTRNLDDRGTTYSYNIYDRQQNTVYPAALMNYSGAKSIVSLRNYAMSEKDKYHYYEFRNGEIRTPYIDAEDGLCRTARNNIVSYSDSRTCAEILLQLIPVYITDTWEPDAVKTLRNDGTDSIYCEDGILYYTDDKLDLTDFYHKEQVIYKAEYVR